jgi:hypothetical protein
MLGWRASGRETKPPSTPASVQFCSSTNIYYRCAARIGLVDLLELGSLASSYQGDGTHLHDKTLSRTEPLLAAEPAATHTHSPRKRSWRSIEPSKPPGNIFDPTSTRSIHIYIHISQARCIFLSSLSLWEHSAHQLPPNGLSQTKSHHGSLLNRRAFTAQKLESKIRSA